MERSTPKYYFSFIFLFFFNIYCDSVCAHDPVSMASIVHMCISAWVANW